MKKFTIILAASLMILTAACSSVRIIFPTSTNTPEPTQTQWPTETPSPTPDPLTLINLEDMFLKDGEEIMNCTGSEIEFFSEEEVAELNPQPYKAVRQSILCAGDEVGTAFIFLYENSEQAAAAYANREKEEKLNDLGEQASIWTGCGMIYEVGKQARYGCWANVTMQRCNSVVSIGVDGVQDSAAGTEMVTTYAARLDEKLSEEACFEK